MTQGICQCQYFAEGTDPHSVPFTKAGHFFWIDLGNQDRHICLFGPHVILQLFYPGILEGLCTLAFKNDLSAISTYIIFYRLDAICSFNPFAYFTDLVVRE